jgi:hypothetical protein
MDNTTRVGIPEYALPGPTLAVEPDPDLERPYRLAKNDHVASMAALIPK